MYEQYNIQYCFKYKTLNFTETTVTTLQGKGKPFNGNEGLIGAGKVFVIVTISKYFSYIVTRFIRGEGGAWTNIKKNDWSKTLMAFSGIYLEKP